LRGDRKSSRVVVSLGRVNVTGLKLAPPSVMMPRVPMASGGRFQNRIVLPEILVDPDDVFFTEASTQVLVQLRAQRVRHEAVGIREALDVRHASAHHQIADEHVIFGRLFARPVLVHQLVAQRVAELVVVAAERQGHPPFQILGKAEHAFRNETRENVGLLEMLVR
jgi:hypothetical protein